MYRKFSYCSEGCCICGTKSSSSKFVSSSKYEDCFMRCFQLTEMRDGLICNPCVLICKRWYRLPKDTAKNWKHVVDSRVRNRRRNNNDQNNNSNRFSRFIFKKKRKHTYIPRSKRSSDEAPIDNNDNDDDSQEESDSGTDSGDEIIDENGIDKLPVNVNTHHHAFNFIKHDSKSFIDFSYWIQRITCCGLIFIGKNNEILLDENSFKPCKKKI